MSDAGLPAPRIQLTDDEWRDKLTAAEFAVLRRAGTERPFTGEYTDTKTPGVYECRACGAELFRSTEKFESHCGWPSFFDPANSDAVILRRDDSLGMTRVEVLCANCHSHLGHVFEGEGYPTPTDQRYCINSVSLRLVPAGA
ncbi:peptide-methionine (R)-S-oxide reductase [Mycolicibacterium cosmeticum]|uniref:peptide-methionine (R)-S-oxide reductase n=1 Tax=Mycolicibacterium cosmeticum TaxID=258533 RepID=W9B7E1_MYCCO|nr:peptide-methionine (R)-S-oxide reductase MsrB [Mycolicibacterium cosmeticum]TLH73992.1 peptide-methionine (R)-S-oxide reductase [Mycolicibacterium cosmeticum]CDO10907.1 methionine-R-sulfoxide reductase [Mycolicibacterium cosmeticum]